MPRKLRALIECVDSNARAALGELALPSYGGGLDWVFSPVDPTKRPRKADVIFVIASAARDTAVAQRVMKHRLAGHFAIGVIVGGDNSNRGSMSGLIRMKPATWERDTRMLLASMTALLCEGLPEVVVCIDWGDAMDALEPTGELLFEWSTGPNADAVPTVFNRLNAQLSGRKCLGMICLLGGGQNRWFKELRMALNACHGMLTDDGIVLGGDSMSPFGGKPGCCVLAVAN